MLASGSGISRNAGQAAYAASNTFLDSFAAYRNGLGLPASVIDIGLVKGAGYVAESVDREAEISRTTHDRLTEDELLSLIKANMTGAEAFCGTDLAQTITGLKLVANKPLPPWALDPRFAHLLPQSNTVLSSEGESGREFRQLVKQAQSQCSAIELICEALRRNLSSLLMMPGEDVDMKKPVVAYGLDSLVAVELRNWINCDLEASVPLMEFMNSASIEHLAGTIARKSKLVDQALFVQEAERVEAVS